METLFLYFIKCFGLIALFFLAYYFLLRKETFFNGNRWFLLAGLFTSVVLPLFFFTKIVWIEPTPVQSFQIPMGTILEKETLEINWLLIISIAYAIGLLVFLIQFGVDFLSLTKVLRGKKIQHQDDFKFVDIKQNTAPFSYFNYIVYNSDLYSASELENILEHEKVHSAQNHSIDVLISRLFCIIFWYNPFMWWYKKAILQNLEFIADSEATKKLADKKSYQITLLKITTHENCVAITNHFYQSLIKKRIVMLNKNQSKKWNSWKYAIVIPALVAFVFLFQIKVIAQEKEITLQDGSTISKETREVVDYTWGKNSTDEEFKNDAKNVKSSGVIFDFSNIKRNSKNEITNIKISFSDKLGNAFSRIFTDENGIEPIHFRRDIDRNGKGEIGFFTAKQIDKEVKINNVNAEDVIAIQNTEKNPVVTINTNGATNNKPVIYVNGVRTDDDINKIDPKSIESINVTRGLNTVKYGKYEENGVISIITKNGIEIPTPPTPPNVPNFIVKSPKFPKAPKAPKGTPTENKIAWKNYEKQMKAYELQVKKMQPEMEDYKENMKVYEEKMKVYEEKIKVYEEQMGDYEKKMEEIYAKPNK